MSEDAKKYQRVGPCCEKAAPAGCVCEEAWDCPSHGEYHSRSLRKESK